MISESALSAAEALQKELAKPELVWVPCPAGCHSGTTGDGAQCTRCDGTGTIPHILPGDTQTIAAPTGRPKAGYRTADGKRVPGTTTIISKFRDPGGLIHWAWDLGMQGIDYNKVREDAASAGTLAHDLVQQWIRAPNRAPTVEGEPEITAKAWNAFNQFLKWAESSRLVVTETELPLVSEKHRYGGTLDAMMVNGCLSLGDWKTSNAVYGDYLFQLGAYALLWEEHFPERPLTGGFDLIRFSKDHADFAHHHWQNIDEAKEGFLMMRRLYSIKSVLDKRVK